MKGKIKLETQQTEWYCAPASVKMVLDSLGCYKSQDALAELMHVTKDGCDISQIENGVKNLGFEVRYRKNSSLDEVEDLLRKEIYPIFYWNRRMEGHYSVFAGIDSNRVYVADPGNSRRITSFTKERFLERWKDIHYPRDEREIIIITRR